MDEKELGIFHSPTGGISALRVGFFVCLAAAIVLSLFQVWILVSGKPGDISGLVYSFLTGAFGGKVGQSFAEKGQ